MIVGAPFVCAILCIGFCRAGGKAAVNTFHLSPAFPAI
jgi:hypothetical protein